MEFFFSKKVLLRTQTTLLRADPMPISRWPTQNELNGLHEGSLSHNVLSGSISPPTTGLSHFHRSFAYIMSSGFVILRDSCVCECVCVSVSYMCFLCHFFGSFVFVLSIMISLFLFCLFYYYSLDACLFSNKRRRGYGSR